MLSHNVSLFDYIMPMQLKCLNLDNEVPLFWSLLFNSSLQRKEVDDFDQVKSVVSALES